MAATDKEKTITKAVIAVGILLVVYLILTRRGGTGDVNNVTVNEQGDVSFGGFDPFEYPYLTTTPGIPDTRGDTIFNTGDTNVHVGTIGANGLSNQYIPIFGLVGMTAVKG